MENETKIIIDESKVIHTEPEMRYMDVPVENFKNFKFSKITMEIAIILGMISILGIISLFYYHYL